MAVGFSARVRRRLRNTWHGARLLTFAPRKFFDERVGRYGLRQEFLFVLFVGLIAFVGWAFAVRVVVEPFQLGGDLVPGTLPGLPRETFFRLWGRAVFESFVEVFVIWLYYSLALFVLTIILTERGTLFVLSKHVAWSLYPLVFGYLFHTIGLLIAFRSIEEVETDLRGSPDRDVEFLFGHGLEDPVIVALTVVLIPFVLWAGYLMTFPLENVRGVSRRTARRIVVIPVVLHVLYLVREVVGAIG